MRSMKPFIHTITPRSALVARPHTKILKRTTQITVQFTTSSSKSDTRPNSNLSKPIKITYSTPSSNGIRKVPSTAAGVPIYKIPTTIKMTPEKQQRRDRYRATANTPTHFLCFPIASETTVPRLAEAIEHWKVVTTKPADEVPVRPRRRHFDEDEDGQGGDIGAPSSGARPGAGSEDVDPATYDTADNDLPNVQRPTGPTFAERLKVLPSIVTRAPGTYHLTLGVMNLKDDAMKLKALEILHGLDLKGLLREAGSTQPRSHKPGRTWEDEEPDTIKSKGIEKADRSSNAQTKAEVKAENGEMQILGTDQPPERLRIALTGLGGFPALKNARVLWARPYEYIGHSEDMDRPVLSEPRRLYNFGLHIMQPFRDAGIITETRPLTLHATVANMRLARKQPSKVRYSKKIHGLVGQVDARDIGRVWNLFDGQVESAVGRSSEDAEEEDEQHQMDQATTSAEPQSRENEFIWIDNLEIDRVAICELGASKHDDPVWGEWYPAISDGERLIFDE